jgi:hypothetical protein
VLSKNQVTKALSPGTHFIALHYITLHCIALYYIISLHITIDYITVDYITSRYITLHYITLNYITLQYIALHNIIGVFVMTMHEYAARRLPYHSEGFGNSTYREVTLTYSKIIGMLFTVYLQLSQSSWSEFSFVFMCLYIQTPKMLVCFKRLKQYIHNSFSRCSRGVCGPARKSGKRGMCCW